MAACWVSLIWLAAFLGSPAHADLFATRLTDANQVTLRVGGDDADRRAGGNDADRRVGGDDADAGVGDWVLGNGTVCAAVSDLGHESHLAMQGGVLIDLGHCGAANDQWSVLQPLHNLSPSWEVPIREIRAERDDLEARVVVQTEGDGVRGSLTYAVSREQPNELRVRVRMERIGEGPRLFALGAVVLHSSAQMRPFTVSTRTPERSLGFVHPAVDTGSILSLVRGMVAADAHVLVGDDRVEPPLSYGLRVESTRLEWKGRADPLPTIHINGKDFTLMGVPVHPWWIGSAEPPGWLQLAQLPLMDVPLGGAVSYEIVVWLGRRADAASVTDALHADGVRVEGQIDDPATRLHVDTLSGAPVTMVRSDPQGRLDFRVPPGRYRLRALAPGGRAATHEFETGLEAGFDGSDLGRLAVGAPAQLALPRGETMRLVFIGQGDTPDPRFGDDLLGFRVGADEIPGSRQSNAVSLAGVEADPASVTIAPGRYRVLATRGLEFGVNETLIELSPGSQVELELPPPERAIETPGWIAADLHVHSGESFDSSLPLADQLRAFAAQGAEVLVSTEHDRVIDPGPTLARLGLAGRIAGISGVEVTSTVAGGESPYTIGHSNAFPVVYRARAYRGGAPRAEGRRLRDVRADLRASDPGALLQLNHARGKPGQQADLFYFSHLAVPGEPYDPARPLDDEPNRVLLEPDPESGLRDLDFDAFELLNGTERGRYGSLRADWLSLLLQGERRTATANSDSHHAWELVGIPRTYVRVADDSPSALDLEAFASSLREGRAFGTSGPFVEARLDGTGPGGLHRGASGALRLAIRAAPWVPVAEARIIVNGRVVERRKVSAGEEIEVPLRFDGDAFVIAEVEGPASGVYALLLPGAAPLAFTNPIFVDADGDERWTAPGLPNPPPELLRP